VSPQQVVWDAARLIADVEAGPQGPRIGAFFDFDGTLIDGYSLGAFARHHLRSGHVTPLDLGRMLLLGLRAMRSVEGTSEEDFEAFFVLGMRAWGGRSEDELVELGERLWHQGIAGALYPEAWRLVEAHRKAGHTVVLASSATRFQVEPAARALGVEHVLVTPVEFEGGIATGRPGGPPLWRAGKGAAVQAFAPAHDVDLQDSYAYSNGTEDVPFLSTVGRARALNPEPGLAAHAAAAGWPVVRFRSRGTGVREVARTVAGAAGLVGGFGAGVALGALNGSRRGGVDLGIALGGELGTALAGVKLDVRGAQHLESARPAVFLFNHQSQLDVMLLARLLRGGFTAVAKKEAANTPVFGAMFRWADFAFVDRGNTTQAREALAPAVERLRQGISLVMAPEGTRSDTPALGPFKKGAFHVAMQAGVPLVPIVIRNAGELMWRGASTIREGTVQITVLPPVPTQGWTVEDLDKHVEEVRNAYLETLGAWDGPAPAVQVTAGPSGPVAAPLDWGSSREMNPLETAMWRSEAADPRLRANVTLLEMLDATPDWDRLVAAHEWASRMVPRMRQRVVEPALGVGAPAWVTVERLDLDRHLTRIRLAPGSRLLDVVRDVAREPFDRDRPLWRVVLVEGLPGGGAAYIVVVHHSATDGLGAVQLMGRLHSRTRAHDPARPEPAASVGRDESRVDLLVDQVSRAPLDAVRRGVDLGTGLLRRIGHPRKAVGTGLRVARSLGRSLGPTPGGVPVLAERGGEWRFDTLEYPLADLRAGAKAAGGSVNDGFLAAVLGGVRRYHEVLGEPVPDTLPVGFPISLRSEDDPAGGNRFTGARLDGPLAETDAAERVRAVRRYVLQARAGAPLDAVGLLAGALTWAPAPVLGAVSGRMTAANDVQVSTLPGLAHEAYIAGARITAMFPFGPLPGCAAMVTMISHAGTCCVGVNSDSAAVERPAVLVECLRAGLDEVAALA
jgi:HAD superfamily hydrolase (TIGR01490 family)